MFVRLKMSKRKLPSLTLRHCKHCRIKTYFEYNSGTEKAECRNCHSAWPSRYAEHIEGYYQKTPIISK